MLLAPICNIQFHTNARAAAADHSLNTRRLFFFFISKNLKESLSLYIKMSVNIAALPCGAQ